MKATLCWIAIFVLFHHGICHQDSTASPQYETQPNYPYEMGATSDPLRHERDVVVDEESTVAPTRSHSGPVKRDSFFTPPPPFPKEPEGGIPNPEEAPAPGRPKLEEETLGLQKRETGDGHADGHPHSHNETAEFHHREHCRVERQVWQVDKNLNKSDTEATVEQPEQGQVPETPPKTEGGFITKFLRRIRQIFISEEKRADATNKTIVVKRQTDAEVTMQEPRSREDHNKTFPPRFGRAIGIPDFDTTGSNHSSLAIFSRRLRQILPFDRERNAPTVRVEDDIHEVVPKKEAPPLQIEKTEQPSDLFHRNTRQVSIPIALPHPKPKSDESNNTEPRIVQKRGVPLYHVDATIEKKHHVISTADDEARKQDDLKTEQTTTPFPLPREQGEIGNRERRDAVPLPDKGEVPRQQPPNPHAARLNRQVVPLPVTPFKSSEEHSREGDSRGFHDIQRREVELAANHTDPIITRSDSIVKKRQVMPLPVPASNSSEEESHEHATLRPKREAMIPWPLRNRGGVPRQELPVPESSQPQKRQVLELPIPSRNSTEHAISEDHDVHKRQVMPLPVPSGNSGEESHERVSARPKRDAFPMPHRDTVPRQEIPEPHQPHKRQVMPLPVPKSNSSEEHSHEHVTTGPAVAKRQVMPLPVPDKSDSSEDHSHEHVTTEPRVAKRQVMPLPVPNSNSSEEHSHEHVTTGPAVAKRQVMPLPIPDKSNSSSGSSSSEEKSTEVTTVRPAKRQAVPMPHNLDEDEVPQQVPPEPDATEHPPEYHFNKREFHDSVVTTMSPSVEEMTGEREKREHHSHLTTLKPPIEEITGDRVLDKRQTIPLPVPDIDNRNLSSGRVPRQVLPVEDTDTRNVTGTVPPRRDRRHNPNSAYWRHVAAHRRREEEKSQLFGDSFKHPDQGRRERKQVQPYRLETGSELKPEHDKAADRPVEQERRDRRQIGHGRPYRVGSPLHPRPMPESEQRDDEQRQKRQVEPHPEPESDQPEHPRELEGSMLGHTFPIAKPKRQLGEPVEEGHRPPPLPTPLPTELENDNCGRLLC